MQCVKKLTKAGNKPRRVSPPQRRNKIKIAISGDMRIGNRTLHPKRFDSFSKKTENLLGCNPLCQKSNAFLTVSIAPALREECRGDVYASLIS